MPSAFIHTDSDIIPSNAGEVIRPFFSPKGSGFELWNEYWYFESAPQFTGSMPEEAIIIIPSSSRSKHAFDMAVNTTSSASLIKHDMPVIGKREWSDADGQVYYDVVWVGYVESIRHIGGRKNTGKYADHLRIKAVSVKKVLRDVFLNGHFAWDGTQIVFRDGIPLPVNPRGMPNWTKTADTGLFLPAVSPDWGLLDSETVPNKNQVTPRNVTYCTLYMLIQYAKAVFSSEMPTEMITAWAAATQHFAGLKRLPNFFPYNFIWPDSFGANLDNQYIGNFNNALGQNNNVNQGGARKGRELVISQGLPLCGDGAGISGLFDILFESSGGYTWGLEIGPNQDNPSDPIDITLQSLPSRPQAAIESFPMYYGSGIQSGIKKPVVTSFEYEESNSGTYTRAIGKGSRIQVEGRKSTETGGKFARTWSERDFDSFRCDCVIAGVITEDSVRKALKFYPNLFADYSFLQRANPAEDTAYEDYPIAKAPRPVSPYLLSYFGTQVGDLPTDYIPYPVRTEILINGETEWDLGPEQDGYVTWEFGRVHFESFRELGIGENDRRLGAFIRVNANKPYEVESVVIDGVTKQGWAIRQNDIRCTFAVPLDASLQFGAMSSNDQYVNADESLYETIQASPDALKFHPDMTRTAVLDLSVLYDIWLRVNSWPIPEAAGGTKFTDKRGFNIADAIRNNYPLLRQHVLKWFNDRSRLQRNGYFDMEGYFNLNYPIGSQISGISKLDGSKFFRLDCCIAGRIFSTVKNGQDQWASKTRYIPC